VSVVSALLLVAVVALPAAAIGVGVGAGLAPRILERKRRRAAEQAGMTVSQMLAHIVTWHDLTVDRLSRFAERS